jgi:hypothetical protein
MSTEKWDLIKNLDLKSVKDKLTSKRSWWKALFYDSTKVESEYRQFLYLIATNPDKCVVPWSEDLDDFWHQHILDTDKYSKDCQNIFGKFVHHNPHLPIGSDKQVKAFTETKQMYRDAFKDKAKDKTSDSSGCGTFMPVVFCASADSSHCNDSSHHDSSSHSDGGHSCGGHGCSSCGSH